MAFALCFQVEKMKNDGSHANNKWGSADFFIKSDLADKLELVNVNSADEKFNKGNYDLSGDFASENRYTSRTARCVNSQVIICSKDNASAIFTIVSPSCNQVVTWRQENLKMYFIFKQVLNKKLQQLRLK